MRGALKYTLLKGVGGISFASILALNPEVAFSLEAAGSCFQERTGASATTPSAVGDPVGSLRNWGTLGGWLTAPTDDTTRPILRRSSAGKLYLEYDGSNDVLTGALAALRGAAGWTIIGAERYTVSGTMNVFFVSTTSSSNTRAANAVITANVATGGRRNNADATVNVTGSSFLDQDFVHTGIGNYTATTATLRGNGAQLAQNTSWLTSGVTPTDGGSVAVGGTVAAATLMTGRFYAGLIFPSALSGASLTLAETWAAQQAGVFF